MQNIIRAIVTLFFFGLIVIGIIFASIIVVVPKEKLARIKSGNIAATSTTKSFFDKYFLDILQPVFAPKETATQEVAPTQATLPQSNEAFTAPGPIEAPKQSSPVTKAQIPKGVTMVSISATGFSPNSFSVSAGSDVAIALEATDAFSHVLLFDSPLLNQIVVGASAQGSGIRVIAFKAPDIKGEYVFRCSIPGHSDRGEVGKMIVK
ncbi:MAG: hypothetical protein WCO21_02420 [bacterium]|nr:hypothetical protein [Candidatus Jorgensenbacteria bacterium]